MQTIEDISEITLNESIQVFTNEAKLQISEIANIKCKDPDCQAEDLSIIAISLNENSNLNPLICPSCIHKHDKNDFVYLQHIKEKKIPQILRLKSYGGFEKIYSRIKVNLNGDRAQAKEANKKLMSEFEEEINSFQERTFDALVKVKDTLIPAITASQSQDLLESENFITERLQFPSFLQNIANNHNDPKLMKEFIKNYKIDLNEAVKALDSQMKLYISHKNGILLKKIQSIIKEAIENLEEKLTVENLLKSKESFYFDPLKKSNLINLDKSNKTAIKAESCNYSSLLMDLTLMKGKNTYRWRYLMSGIKKTNQFIAFGLIEKVNFNPVLPRDEFLKNMIGIASNNDMYNFEKSGDLVYTDNFTVEINFDCEKMLLEIFLVKENEELTKIGKAQVNIDLIYAPIVVLGYPGNSVTLISNDE